MMNLHSVFSALCLAWVTSELWIGWRKRSTDRARTRDAGTLRLLLVTIYACVAASAWLAARGVAPITLAWRDPLLQVGVAMMIAGMLLRWWSIHVLARFFTVDVSLRSDHQLVRSGPYHRLRHPSYTGALMSFYGFAMGLGNWSSLAVLAVPVTLAFLWRIRIEERVLADAFPEQYPRYVQETKRLVPYLW